MMRMKQLSRFIVTVAAVVSVSTFLAAQSAPQKAAAASQAPAELGIHWLGQASFARARSSAEACAALSELAGRDDRRHVVVQFSRALAESERARAREAGLELLAYLGDH